MAATGENYEKYCEYAASRGWKLFTRKYLHTWVARKRIKIRAARVEHKEHVRRMSMYDRERRIETLERDMDLINNSLLGGAHECNHCGFTHVGHPPEMMLRLMEQKRKTAEAIAKERNEWLKQDSPSTAPATEARDRLKQAFAEILDKAKEAKVIAKPDFVGQNPKLFPVKVRVLPEENQTTFEGPHDTQVEGRTEEPRELSASVPQV